MNVVDIASRRPQATIAQLRQVTRIYPDLDPRFAGMPFVSEETNAGGWPVEKWIDDENATHSDGRQFARLAMAAMAMPHPYHLGSRALEVTLEAIVAQHVAKRVRGGKGSRTMSRAADGFVREIARTLEALLQSAFDMERESRS